MVHLHSPVRRVELNIFVFDQMMCLISQSVHWKEFSPVLIHRRQKCVFVCSYNHDDDDDDDDDVDDDDDDGLRCSV